MKKSIIITLLAVGIIAGYMLINPANDVKESSQAEPAVKTVISSTPKTVDLPNPSLSNESDTALLMEESMRDQVASALEESNPEERYNRIMEILEHLSPENWRGVIEAFQMHDIENPQSYWNASPPKWKSEWKFFLQRVGEVAGKEAVTYFVGQNTHNCKACLNSWAIADPTEAIEWLSTTSLNTEIDPVTRNKLYGAAILGMAQSSPYLITELLEQIPVEDRYLYANSLNKNLINLLTESLGINETEQLFLSMVDRAQINNEVNSKFISQTFVDLAANSMMSQLLDGTKGVEDAAAWLKDHIGQPYVQDKLIWETGEMLARKDGMLAIEWLDSSFAEHPNIRVVGYGAAMHGWIEAEGVNVAAEWLNENSDHPEYDTLAYALAEKVWKTDPDAAIEWINSMSDEDLKAKLMKQKPFIQKRR